MAELGTVTSVDRALVDAGERFAALLRTTTNPLARAIGHWTAAETAAHVAIVSYFDALSCGLEIDAPFPVEDLLERLERARVEDIEVLNALSLELFTERDLERVEPHITANVHRVAGVAAEAPDGAATWLGGLEITNRAVAGHLLGELVIHALDIARSQGMAWAVDEEDARLAFDECYIPVLDAGRELMAPPATTKPVSVEFRVAGADPTVIELGPGRMSRRPPGERPADVVFTSDAVTTLLTMFERIGPVRALTSRRLKIGGRRPWRVARMRKALSMP